MEALRDSNPVELMQRRAGALTERGADLKRLADAWDPLYKSLSEDQRKRMAYVTIVAMRGMRDVIEQRHSEHDDDDE
jgi:hypothetical protein